MVNDLDKLELEMIDEMKAMKVAQTRLERRTYRPGVDLCRDDPQYGLVDEVNQLETTRANILMKQRESRSVTHISLTLIVFLFDVSNITTYSIK